MTHDAPVEYKGVYLWHWPIRAMHWIAATCVIVLAVTGFYIGKPYFFTSGSASDHFLMGRVRFTHFAAAGVLVATGILRFYWLFMGNKFERWRALFPVKKSDWVNMWKVIKAYLFIRPWEAPQYLGHNPLQQLSYTAIYLLALMQVGDGLLPVRARRSGRVLLHLVRMGGRPAGQRADGAVRAPLGHVAVADVHPDPHLPAGALRRPAPGEHDLDHDRRRALRPFGRPFRR